jgi:hypothetical protein
MRAILARWSGSRRIYVLGESLLQAWPAFSLRPKTETLSAVEGAIWDGDARGYHALGFPTGWPEEPVPVPHAGVFN